jgi:hypothetical protein
MSAILHLNQSAGRVLEMDCWENMLYGGIIICIIGTLAILYLHHPDSRKDYRTIHNESFLTWRRCLYCGRYEHTDALYCEYHPLPAALLPLSNNQQARVMLFLLNTTVHKWFQDTDARDKIGKYFLWLEEKTGRDWDDASSVLSAYTSDLKDEDDLEAFDTFLVRYEEMVEQEIEMKPALTLFMAQQTFLNSNGEVEDISLEE